MVKDWRENLEPAVRLHLEKQINESHKQRKAYLSAGSSGNAQLWIAVANLSRQLFDVNLKLNYLEKVVRDSMVSKAKERLDNISGARVKKKISKKIASKKRK